MDETNGSASRLDAITERFADAERLLREAAASLDQLGEARAHQASVVQGLTESSRATSEFVQAASRASATLVAAHESAREAMVSARSFFDGTTLKAIEARVGEVAEQVEALRDETIRQLETRCRAYESVLSGRQRRKVEALFPESGGRPGVAGR